MQTHTHTRMHKPFAHTHKYESHSSDEKENMSGMKASREKRHENTAVSQTCGLK